MLENMWLKLATRVLVIGIALDMDSPDLIAVNCHWLLAGGTAGSFQLEVRAFEWLARESERP